MHSVFILAPRVILVKKIVTFYSYGSPRDPGAFSLTKPLAGGIIYLSKKCVEKEAILPKRPGLEAAAGERGLATTFEHRLRKRVPAKGAADGPVTGRNEEARPFAL